MIDKFLSSFAITSITSVKDFPFILESTSYGGKSTGVLGFIFALENKGACPLTATSSDFSKLIISSSSLYISLDILSLVFGDIVSWSSCPFNPLIT